MSSLEIFSLIYRSPLQGHLINRTRKQTLKMFDKKAKEIFRSKWYDKY